MTSKIFEHLPSLSHLLRHNKIIPEDNIEKEIDNRTNSVIKKQKSLASNKRLNELNEKIQSLKTISFGKSGFLHFGDEEVEEEFANFFYFRGQRAKAAFIISSIGMLLEAIEYIPPLVNHIEPRWVFLVGLILNLTTAILCYLVVILLSISFLNRQPRVVEWITINGVLCICVVTLVFDVMNGMKSYS